MSIKYQHSPDHDLREYVKKPYEGLEDIREQLAQKAKEFSYNKTPKGRKFDTALITFITDDGDIEDKLTMLPIFQRQAVPFCTAVIPAQIGTTGRLTLAEIKDLENAGHEILSHSYSHQRLPDITDTALDDEVRLSKEYLDANGLNVKNFAVPYGAYNDKVKLAIQKYFRSSRISTGYYNSKPLETFELKSIWFENVSTVSGFSGQPRNSYEHYKYFIDQAVANNNWLIISTHSWEIKGWGFESLLEQVVAYAKSVAPVVTVNQALDKLDNIVESALFSKEKPYESHFAISPDGKMVSNMTFFKKLATNSVTATTPLSSFENNVVSVCAIQSASATGFPQNAAGVLKTYKFIPQENSTDNGYAFQEYKIYGQDNMYIRTAKGDGTWGTFFLANYRDNKILTKELINHKPSNLSPNHITTWGYSGTEATNAGMPTGKAGVLYSYAFGHYSNDYAYYYEVYKVRNSTDYFIRSGQANDTWGAWYNPNDPLNNPVIIAATDAFNASSAYSAFTDNKITNCKITNANGTGFPDNVGGMLITHRLGGTDLAFNFQIYHKYNSNDTYKRICNTSGVWQPWVKYSAVAI